MQRLCIMPDVITCNALISACEKGKQPDCAMEAFQALQQQGAVPGTITCNALVTACEKGTQQAWALEVFRAM